MEKSEKYFINREVMRTHLANSAKNEDSSN